MEIWARKGMTNKRVDASESALAVEPKHAFPLRALIALRLYAGKGVLWLIEPAQDEMIGPDLDKLKEMQELFFPRK
jgi:hypothetical protein